MTRSSLDLIVLTQRRPAIPTQTVQNTLALKAEERQRSRYRCQTTDGTELLLNLPRGTVLQEGDLLTTTAADWWVRVQAQPEPVFQVTAETPLALLKAAYHLGNRHVPLEVTPQVLKLSPDPVLRDMLEHLGGLMVQEGIEPFYPELGAYGHSH